MRFDTTLYYHVGDDYSWSTLFDEMRETVELIDELGYTGLWLAEHHFAWDGWYRSGSNPLLMGAEVARWSDRLRMGQCGLVLPDWHPLRLAEDIAFLDQMTKGRVDIGIAPGINSRACGQFHPAGDRRERDKNRRLYEENAKVLIKVLENEAFEHEGEFWKFPAVDWQDTIPHGFDSRFHDATGKVRKLGISPGPYQSPRPGMWAMSESKSSAEFCARNGINTMSQSLSLGRMGENWDHYRTVASETQGRDVGFGEGLAVMRNTYVAETYEDALETARPGYNRLFAWAKDSPLHIRSNAVVPEEFDEADNQLDWLEFQIKIDSALVGTPETVVQQVQRLADFGCTHLALFLNIPGLSFEQVKNSLRLFATEVMPHIKIPDSGAAKLAS
jgi:alkanesulfonate monooxygenase SsuD/methylene tetrahydromethanopterin reductase-like flavin-dependent oxidoreductase (luciferase family)